MTLVHREVSEKRLIGLEWPSYAETRVCGSIFTELLPVRSCRQTATSVQAFDELTDYETD
jgi:hypothetical protein